MTTKFDLKLHQKYQLKVHIESGLSKRYSEYKNLNDDFFETQINSLKI